MYLYVGYIYIEYLITSGIIKNSLAFHTLAYWIHLETQKLRTDVGIIRRLERIPLQGQTEQPAYKFQTKDHPLEIHLRFPNFRSSLLTLLRG